MIYEIFKFAFENTNTPWLAFAGAVLASTYSIYILCWLSGWILQQSYSFVFEGKRSINNYMMRYVDYFLGAGLNQPIKGEKLNGWYASSDIGKSSYWKYRQYKNGTEVNFTEVLDNVYKNASGGITVFKGFDPHLFIIFSPAFFTILFLLADTFPIAAASIAGYYFMLVLARKAVRLASKFEAHMKDPDAHKGD